MNLNDKIDKIEETIIGSDYFEGKTSCNKNSEWGVVRYLSKGDDRIYEGQCLLFMADGFGRLINSDGSYYIGQFRCDLENGFRKYFDSDGNLLFQG
jgi:hypothetical protein